MKQLDYGHCTLQEVSHDKIHVVALICHTSDKIVNDTSITKHNFSSIHSSFQKPFALKRKPFSNSKICIKRYQI